jgi:hypothetical protein
LALACESTVLINLSDGDLDRCVVLGLDDAVGGAALAGDITEDEVSFNCISPRDFCGAYLLLGLPTGQRVLPCRSPCWRFLDGGIVRLLFVLEDVVVSWGIFVQESKIDVGANLASFLWSRALAQTRACR